VLVGHAIGAGDEDRARRSAIAGIVIGTSFMCTSAIAFRLFPEALARAYTGDRTVIALAATLIPIAGVFQVFDGIQAVAAGVLPQMAAIKPKRDKKKRRRQIKPPERRCQDCVEFLKDKKTLELPCKQCATPIYWPPESQLQTHLGAWSEPSLCGACKRDVMEAARAAEREALRHNPPIGGAAEAPVPEVAASEPAKDEAPIEPTV